MTARSLQCVAVGRAATAPDVVQDLLRPHQVEEGDEPGADRPPFRVPQAGPPRARARLRYRRLVQAIRNPKATVSRPTWSSPAMPVRRSLASSSARRHGVGVGLEAAEELRRRRRSPRRRSRSRRWPRRAARGRPWRACDLSGRDGSERSTSRPAGGGAAVHCTRPRAAAARSVPARDGGDGGRTCSWNLPSSTAVPGHRWSSCSEGRARAPAPGMAARTLPSDEMVRALADPSGQCSDSAVRSRASGPSASRHRTGWPRWPGAPVATRRPPSGCRTCRRAGRGAA